MDIALRPAGKDPHVTADSGNIGAAIQGFYLQLEPAPMHPIVAVHARDKSRRAMLEARVEARDKASMFAGNQLDAGISGREASSDCSGSIHRPIVDDNAFPVRECLSLYAAQAKLDCRSSVEGRKQDGNSSGHFKTFQRVRRRDSLVGEDRTRPRHRARSLDDADVMIFAPSESRNLPEKRPLEFALELDSRMSAAANDVDVGKRALSYHANEERVG